MHFILELQEVLQNLVGSILYIITGALAVDTYKDMSTGQARDSGLALGVSIESAQSIVCCCT
jgi:hypothetical protein